MISFNTKILLLAFGIVIVNSIVGHFFAPNGILLTPLVLIIMAVLIVFFTKKIKPIWKSVILAGLISLHDIGIKLYSGGRHDYEGLGWTHALLFIGLIPVYIILIVGIFRATNYSVLNRIIAIILFPLLICIHLLCFKELGLGRFYWYEWN